MFFLRGPPQKGDLLKRCQRQLKYQCPYYAAAAPNIGNGHACSAKYSLDFPELGLPPSTLSSSPGALTSQGWYKWAQVIPKYPREVFPKRYHNQVYLKNMIHWLFENNTSESERQLPACLETALLARYTAKEWGSPMALKISRSVEPLEIATHVAQAMPINEMHWPRRLWSTNVQANLRAGGGTNL